MANKETGARVRRRGRPFPKGVSGNPLGRPVGQRDYATIYMEALRKLAVLNGKTSDELEEEILSQGIKLARKGDYRFYKDVLDRVYGTAIQKTDVTSNGKDINAENSEQIKLLTEQINALHRGGSSPRNGRTAGAVGTKVQNKK
jgi:hypothetical protein